MKNTASKPKAISCHVPIHSDALRASWMVTTTTTVLGHLGLGLEPKELWVWEHDQTSAPVHHTNSAELQLCSPRTTAGRAQTAALGPSKCPLRSMSSIQEPSKMSIYSPGGAQIEQAGDGRAGPPSAGWEPFPRELRGGSPGSAIAHCRLQGAPRGSGEAKGGRALPLGTLGAFLTL